MDDNKFNKIMEDYVSSTSGNMETDLKKLPERPNGNKIFFSRIVLALGGVIIALILIILPIHFLGIEHPTNKIQYYDNNSVSQEAVDNISQLDDYGIKDYLDPKILVQPLVFVYSAVNNQSLILGGKLVYNVYDYNFEVVIIDIIQKQNKLQKFNFFDDFTNNTTWGEVNVKYRVSFDDMKETYKTQIYFSTDKYDYFVETETYEQLEIPTILDYIY